MQNLCKMFLSLLIFFHLIMFPGISALAADSTAEGTILENSASHTRIRLTAGWQTGEYKVKFGGSVAENGVRGYTNDPYYQFKFPIDSFMLQIGANHRFADHFELRGTLGLTVNQNTRASRYEDWLRAESPGIKTSGIEADNEVHGWEADLGARYWFSPFSLGGASELSLGLGLGMTYKNYRWDLRDGTYWHLSDSGAITRERRPGLLYTYAVDAYMPYLEALAAFHHGGWQLQVGANLFPWLRIKDELFGTRNALHCSCTADGWGWGLSAKARYDFTTSWYATLTADTMWLRAEGEAQEKFGTGEYAGWDFRIDETIYSQQARVAFSLGYRF